MGHPGLTAPRYEHWTEHDERVLAYLHKAFGVPPEKQPEGADLLCGTVRIEVKACREWIKKTRCKGNWSIRRRGRFKFKGHEDADFILFVLEKDGGELLMTMLDAETFFQRFGRYVCGIVWPFIFQPPPREHSSSRLSMLMTGVTRLAGIPPPGVTPMRCSAC